MNCEGCVKPAKTFKEQLRILKERGLNVQDEKQALDILSRTNYYRLRAYWLSYEKDNCFVDGVSFEDVYRLYDFDMRLRHLILRILEPVEVALRTQVAYHIAHTWGPLAYLDGANFANETFHKNMIAELNKEIGRSKEVFVVHHREKYGGNIPVWAVVEVMSFGTLSKMYSNLGNEVRRKIAKKYYGYPIKFVRNWFHVLSVLRNRCAHYGRLYNYAINPRAKLLDEDLESGASQESLFAALLIMGRLTKDRSQWRNFVIELMALIEDYQQVDVALMGFVADWERLLIEQCAS